MSLMSELISNDVAVRHISNSEVTTWLSCKRQYRYAFIDTLQPIKTSDPLARGSIFHDAMYHYWEARLQGKSHEEAMVAAYVAFTDPCDKTVDNTVVMDAQFLWTRYMQFHNGFPGWVPLGTEVKHELKLTNTISMAIKYDFYFFDQNDGKYKILDYKLAYEFWRQEDHDLNGQMPKYMAVLQANDLKVDEGVLEEIRTRSLGAEKQRDPSNLWRRTRYKPSTPKKAAVLKQHVAASLEIEQFRALSPEEQREKALPVLNKHGACGYCNFKNLCHAELEGAQDLSVPIRVGYTRNTYADGYNPITEGIDF